ncbi:hypothetical protein X753_31615 [Mesorhizobium sp. LNJC399B00]|nr:hypothetical protein X753_31615 [Mesorhizobium sp. LNJC399B00]
MGIGRDPALFTPMKHLLELNGNKLSFSIDAKLSSDLLDFKSPLDLQAIRSSFVLRCRSTDAGLSNCPVL